MATRIATASNPASPASLTLAEIDAELERLQQERVSLLDAEAAIPENEKRLLARAAPDAELTTLDLRRRRIAHALEEIDQRETELLRAVPEAKRGERQCEWLAYVDRFEAVAVRARTVAAELAGIQNEVHALHVEAARNGFNPYQSAQAMLPTIKGVLVPWSAFSGLLDQVGMLRRAVSSPMPTAQLWPVRITIFSVVAVGLTQIGFNSGEVAGFAPGVAWSLVESGRATWADPKRIPPKPPAKRPRAR